MASSMGTLTECFASGDVVSAGGPAGGFAGSISGNISESYSTGNVSGALFVGGVVLTNGLEPITLHSIVMSTAPIQISEE